jgi:hypothetical protein
VFVPPTCSSCHRGLGEAEPVLREEHRQLCANCAGGRRLNSQISSRIWDGAELHRRRLRQNAQSWEPAGPSDSPFSTPAGRLLLYVRNAHTGSLRYLDVEHRLILTDAEASFALGRAVTYPERRLPPLPQDGRTRAERARQERAGRRSGPARSWGRPDDGDVVGSDEDDD